MRVDISGTSEGVGDKEQEYRQRIATIEGAARTVNVEEIVERGEGYAIVRKREEDRPIAEATDPRTP